MAKFLVLHHGGGGPPEGEEERKQMMEAYGQWMQANAEAIVDPGSPLGPASSVGEGEAGESPNGFMLIEAADLGAALEIVGSMPMAAGSGRFDVHEATRPGA